MKYTMTKTIHKSKVYLLGLALATSLGFVQYSLAYDNNITINSSELPKLAFETAVVDVQQRLAQIQPNMRLSYVKQ